MTEILQTRLPYDPEGRPALPGISPLLMADWLQVDEAFSGQMAERARLLSEQRAEVVARSQRALARRQQSFCNLCWTGCGNTAKAMIFLQVVCNAPMVSSCRLTGLIRWGRWGIWCKRIFASWSGAATSMC